MFNFLVPKKSIYNKNESEFSGKVTNIEYSNSKITIELKGKEKLILKYYLKENKSELDLKLGQTIKVQGKLESPSNNTVPNTFNYKNYLYYKNIHYICVVNNIEITNKKVNLLYKVKNHIIDKLDTYSKIKPYLYVFILGDDEYLNEDILEAYKTNGLSHLLAVSGMHIGVLSGSILFVLKKIKSKKKYILVILFMWIYAFLTGFKSSILRANTLFTILSLNKIFTLNLSKIKALIIAITILLIVNPFLIMDIGFQYSSLTCFFLLYFEGFIGRHKILGVSLIAFLASLPITISNFYQINLLSIFLNIIIVPLVSLIIYPLCLITFIFPFLENFTNIFILILEFLNNIFNSIDYFIVTTRKLNTFFIILYYLFLLFICKKNIVKGIFCLSLIIFINNMLLYLDNSFYVNILDVGQGDSILIRPENSKGITLIDTGGQVEYKNNTSNYNVSDNTITYLHSLGINHIQNLVLSHGDADHIGDAINLLENVKVENVFFNCGEFNELETKLKKVLEKNNIKYSSCVKNIDVGNNKLQFLNTGIYDNENDNSSVTYIKSGNYKFLFMGDAGIKREKDILQKYDLYNIDFLKVGHHGSNTSSSENFISKIAPKFSLISVGRNNRYGHPKEEILNILKSGKIYRTDTFGSIEIKIKNDGYSIETCKP